MLGVHLVPVRSDAAAPEARKTLFLFLTMSLTTNATEEVGTSTMTSTFSLSIQRLAMLGTDVRLVLVVAGNDLDLAALVSGGGIDDRLARGKH